MRPSQAAASSPKRAHLIHPQTLDMQKPMTRSHPVAFYSNPAILSTPSTLHFSYLLTVPFNLLVSNPLNSEEGSFSTDRKLFIKNNPQSINTSNVTLSIYHRVRDCTTNKQTSKQHRCTCTKILPPICSEESKYDTLPTLRVGGIMFPANTSLYIFDSHLISPSHPRPYQKPSNT